MKFHEDDVYQAIINHYVDSEGTVQLGDLKYENENVAKLVNLVFEDVKDEDYYDSDFNREGLENWVGLSIHKFSKEMNIDFDKLCDELNNKGN